MGIVPSLLHNIMFLFSAFSLAVSREERQSRIVQCGISHNTSTGCVRTYAHPSFITDDGYSTDRRRLQFVTLYEGAAETIRVQVSLKRDRK